jgi:hypothetical protein
MHFDHDRMHGLLLSSFFYSNLTKITTCTNLDLINSILTLPLTSLPSTNYQESFTCMPLKKLVYSSMSLKVGLYRPCPCVSKVLSPTSFRLPSACFGRLAALTSGTRGGKWPQLPLCFSCATRCSEPSCWHLAPKRLAFGAVFILPGVVTPFLITGMYNREIQ